MRIEVSANGFVTLGARRWRCALGRGGVRADKREGDGVTPAGVWKLGRVFWRPDRLGRAPVTGLTCVALHPDWGWCDDPGHPDYNTLVTLPHPARHEILWRDDALYDIVTEIHYNTGPIVPGAGSAIFLHVAKPDYAPTEGCIALSLSDCLEFLGLLDGRAELSIQT